MSHRAPWSLEVGDGQSSEETRPFAERERVSGTFRLELPRPARRDVYVVGLRKGPPIAVGDQLAFPWEVLWLEEREGGGLRLPKGASPFHHLDPAAAENAFVQSTGIPCRSDRIVHDIRHEDVSVSAVSVFPLEAIAEEAGELAPEHVRCIWRRWPDLSGEPERFLPEELALVARLIGVRPLRVV